MSAAKTINLTQRHNSSDSGLPYQHTDKGTHLIYKVITTRNTVRYPIGVLLSRDEVMDLCDTEDWTVNISVPKS